MDHLIDNLIVKKVKESYSAVNYANKKIVYK
jgi:hypothetical protein